ncbi:MAG: hypothetical protein IKN71_00365 [Alphaproteobacteria bacterium]|nr:hypothetical protein [Alphaproteobacteria bacterium]
MVEISAQYMEFLKANYSGVAGRLETLMTESPTGKNPEEIAKSKAKIDEEIKELANDSERVHKYQIWEKVPSILRDRYNGQVPPEVLEAADRDEIYTLRVMEMHPEIKRVDQARTIAQEAQAKVPAAIANTAAAAVFVSAAVAGYSDSASMELANQRLARDALWAAKQANPHMSEEEKKLWRMAWLQSRQETVDTIKKDFAENQPEKLLLHILGKFNAGKISKDELLPQVADLVQRIDTNERHGNLLEYLQTERIQAKIGKFKPETLDILANSVLSKVPEAGKTQTMEKIQSKFSDKNAELESSIQAHAVAQNMLSAKANSMPTNASLTAKERYANMPSIMNHGMEREG